MIVEFDKSFLKSLAEVHDPVVFQRVKLMVIKIEDCKSINEIKQIKKLVGFSSFYRIRFGDYRLGLELIGKNVVRFIILAHRKDIYKSFP